MTRGAAGPGLLSLELAVSSATGHKVYAAHWGILPPGHVERQHLALTLYRAGGRAGRCSLGPGGPFMPGVPREAEQCEHPPPASMNTELCSGCRDSPRHQESGL